MVERGRSALECSFALETMSLNTLFASKQTPGYYAFAGFRVTMNAITALTALRNMMTTQYKMKIERMQELMEPASVYFLGTLS
jgi:hypothetical protein